MKLKGRLTTDRGEPLAGWRVYAADEPAHNYDLAAVTTGRDGAYLLQSDRTLAPGAQPVLALYILDGERLVRVVEPALQWSAEGEAQMDISLSSPPPPVYFLHGRLWDPATGGPLSGATIRTVDRAGVYGEQTVTTVGRGLFDLWLPEREGKAPDLALSVELRGSSLPVAPQAIAWDSARTCSLWTELVWDISGRVTTAEGGAASGVRVEAWVADRFVAAATADAAGGYTLHVPRTAGTRTPPQPTLRIYRGAQLLQTVAGRATAGTLVKRNGPLQGPSLVRANVECVRIEGKRATMSGTIVESTAPAGAAGAVGRSAWFFVEDDDPDKFANTFGGGTPNCEMDLSDQMQPIVSGSISVTPAGVVGTGVSNPNKEPFEFNVTPGLVDWGRFGFGRLDVALEAQAERPRAYTIAGTAIDRESRLGASSLRVEAWDAPETFMLAVATTGADGRFQLELTGDEPPSAHLRFYRDGQLVAKPELSLRWTDNEAIVFTEIDAPAPAPTSYRVTGRVIDRASRTGVGGLRIEAWDSAPRDGGALGVQGVTGSDGSFDLALPAVAPTAAPMRAVRQFAGVDGFGAGNGNGASRVAVLERAVAPAPATPALFFRVYSHDRLMDTVTPEITWASAVGTVLVEVGAPPASSQEVGLHELGESIAGAVDRVQAELARYPKTMGAYVLDEISLDMPVEMRVDQLGQVRTKVVDAATPEKNVGQVRMKVRPVVGATRTASTILDQPLSALLELTPEAIAALEAHRIYSVEDLARAAATGAGRAALNALGLGIDLDELLARATLLAFAPLPQAVREALLKIGVTSLQSFAAGDAVKLAAQLTAAIGQSFTSQDVTAWQASAREALAVPRPSDETQGGSP